MPKKKEPKLSEMPFHLLFLDADSILMKQFDDIEALAMFVSLNSLTRNDYAIVQGDLIKRMPLRSLCINDVDYDDELEDQESGIQVLSPDAIRDLIEHEQ